MINDRYIIKRKLGKGRSSVYLCEDSVLPGKEYAIKILPAGTSKEETGLFKKEYFILQNINHPNIVKSFELGTVLKRQEEFTEIEPGSKFFTLELCPGVPVLNYKGINSEKVLRKVLIQLCSALFYLHQSNYIYYDLKAENLFVSGPEDEPFVQLIDMGLAEHGNHEEDELRRGTADYIAPEIINGLEHDFRVDFYSLGVLLYRIIYGKFPFSGLTELEILKARIETDAVFPESNYGSGLINILKRLLSKQPSERYDSAVQIISDLGAEIDENIYKDWLPAKTFADRRDTINILNTYIKDETSNEVFALHGAEGSGKTSVAFKIYSQYEDAVLISNRNYLSGSGFVKFIVKSIILNEKVYNSIPVEIINQAEELMTGNSEDIVGTVKGLINQIASSVKFTLIFDSFNTYDNYTVEILKSTIPVLQVNKTKVILTENSDKESLSDFINNLRVVDLTPFTEAGLLEYLDLSLASFFPKEELKRLILAYADLLPGSLESFFKDLVLLKIMEFTPGGIELGKDENSEKLLRSSHEEIYSLRLQRLNGAELELVQLLSSFENSLDDNIAAELLEITNSELNELYSSIAQKNILHKRRGREISLFTSEGLKRYIYTSRKRHTKYHKELAENLKAKFPGFNRSELARQFELAREYEETYRILKEEIKDAELQSAYSYEKSIILHLLNLPVKKEYKYKLKRDLCDVYYKLGEFVQMKSLLEELLSLKLNPDERADLLSQKGNCLIGLGEYAKGKELLENILKDSSNRLKENKIKIEIAAAEYNLNQYKNSNMICFDIIHGDADPVEKANAYELLGYNYLIGSHELEEALRYFNEADRLFSDNLQKYNSAVLKMDIGIVYDQLGKSQEAKQYWENSLNINKSIGNIEHEGKILSNMGCSYFNCYEYDTAIKMYFRAKSIAETLGNKKWLAVALSNLGESYLMVSDYQNSINYLNNSMNIFKNVGNFEEYYNQIFLLGKLFYIVGDKIRVKEQLNLFDNEKDENKTANSRQVIMYNYLKALDEICDDIYNPKINIVIKTAGDFLEWGRPLDFSFFIIQTIEYFLNKKSCDMVFTLLKNEKFLEVCKINLYIEAERLFYLGLLSEREHYPNDLESPLFYFENANNLLQSLHVSEITWKVFLELSILYNKRGQKSKSVEYAENATMVLEFLSGNIQETELKNIYLNKAERKTALNQLKMLKSI